MTSPSCAVRTVYQKMSDQVATITIKASITANGQEPSVFGQLDASPADVHDLLLNIRASGDPATLRGIVETHLAELPGKIELKTMQCFRPAPPKPEHRIGQVI